MDLGQSKILDKINDFLSGYQDDLYIGKNPHVFITDEGEYIVCYRQAQQGENPGEIIYRTFFADSTKEIIDNILDFIWEAKVTINGKINRLEFMEHCDVQEGEAMS